MDVNLHARQRCPGTIEQVFRCSVDPIGFPTLFRGFGPIPALTRIELDQPLGAGVTRHVHSADGAVMLESVRMYDPPYRHAYTLLGIKAPLSWLVSAGHADWRFDSSELGTLVHWHYRFELTSPIVWPLAFPLLRLFMLTAMQRCLYALAHQSQLPPER